MTNENETVEQICEKLHNLGGEIHRLVVMGEDEIHTLSHTIDEAQDHIRSSYEREMAIKNHEINGLKLENRGLQESMGSDDLLKMARDIDKKNALIKELTEGLDLCVKALELIYNEECTDYDTPDTYNKAKELVARAKGL